VRDDRLSKFLALILRHKPETVGLELDPAGFVDLDDLAAAIARQPGWAGTTADALRRVAQQDPRRYEVVENRIRARYGHTVPIATPGAPVIPPEWLYHGVARQALETIRTAGLHPVDRQFVHLSTTRQDARAVAERRAPDPVVVTVLARRASEAGIVFYQASSGLYLTRHVPPPYLHLPNP
jgi:putative RNA 2'-phosphotransferase